jgi:hypothetical protein
MFSWFQKSAKKRLNRPAFPAQRRLRFDSLEERVLMAGDVTAAIVGGTNLVITGDLAANAVRIAGTSVPGEYIVSRADRTTTINTGTTPFTASGISNLIIDLGDGNDRVNLVHMRVSGDVSINTGTDAGKDLVKVSLAQIDGKFFVETGDGNDELILTALHVSGDATIDTGLGDDKLYLTVGRVGGLFNVTTGNGNDFVSLSAVNIAGNTTVDTGSDAGKDLVLIAASRFQSAVSVNLGDGDDKLTLTLNRFDSTLSADGNVGSDALVNRFNRFLGGAPTLLSFERFPRF